MVACRYADSKFKKHVTSVAWALWFALPAPLEQIWRTDRTVVAIIGDGGIQDDHTGIRNHMQSEVL